MVLAGIAVVLTLALAGLALHARRLRGRLVAAEGAAARYEALASHLPDVSVLLYDHDLRFTLLDGAAMQTHGWRREDLEGRLIADVIPPGRRDELLEHCNVALRGESITHDWVSVRDAARRYRNVHVPVRDARGAVVGGMMVVRDVTEADALRSAVEAPPGVPLRRAHAADRPHRGVRRRGPAGRRRRGAARPARSRHGAAGLAGVLQAARPRRPHADPRPPTCRCSGRCRATSSTTSS